MNAIQRRINERFLEDLLKDGTVKPEAVAELKALLDADRKIKPDEIIAALGRSGKGEIL